jgi:integrase
MEANIGKSKGLNVPAPKRRRKMRKPKLDGWKAKLMAIILPWLSQHAKLDKGVGYETQSKRRKELFRAFRELRDVLGFKIEDPRNLRKVHLKALGHYWEEKKLAARTIVNRFSILRQFAALIGKAGMVEDLTEFVQNPDCLKFQRAATTDKSWTGNGIDPREIFVKIARFDPLVAKELESCLVIGARVRESVSVRPNLADQTDYVAITYGTKGGRHRTGRMTEEARTLLDAAKGMVSRVDGHIGSRKTTRQSIRRLRYACEKFGITKKELGVTPHGLRVEYVIGVNEAITGAPTPVRGGRKGDVDPELKSLADHTSAEAAGHTRKGITGAYYGTYESMEAKRAEDLEGAEPEVNDGGDDGAPKADDENGEEGGAA